VSGGGFSQQNNKHKPTPKHMANIKPLGQRVLVKRIEALEKQLKAKNTPPKTSAKSAKPKSPKKARS
jgi:hypothetical protein